MNLKNSVHRAWTGSSRCSGNCSSTFAAGLARPAPRAKTRQHRGCCRSTGFPPASFNAKQQQQQPAAAASSQQRLDAAGISQLVRSNPSLLQLLGSADGLSVQELLDGVINVVYAVHGPSGSVIIKQALPYVRAVGESFPLSRDRMDVEAAAMQLLHSCCPAHVPRLLLYDASSSVLAMQYLPPPHHKLLYAIRQGQVLPGLADQLAGLLSSYLAHSSLEGLQPEDAAAVTERLANCDIVAANEQVVLLGPFNPADPGNRWTSPQLDGAVQAIWGDADLQAAAADMLQLYRSSKQALIHNDLHAGNLLVAPGSLYLIDWEFATTGPLAFDLGCLLGNLMLAVLGLQGMEQAELLLQQQQQHGREERQQQGSQQQQQHEGTGAEGQRASRRQQAEWLLQVMQDTWCGFQQLYPSQLAAAQASAAAGTGLFAAQAAASSSQLLLDSCGFAGCCLIG
ncbi:kinase-like domain-containing protein [Scenedesmus sp. NREL 46B-D3]|nr:kinase-like domain-containing protein [Scenedesmus sp. NREL 46B-D3]